MAAERKQRGRVENAPPPAVVEVTVRVKATYKPSSYTTPQPVERVVRKIIDDLSRVMWVGNADYKIVAEVVEKPTDERIAGDAAPADASEAP